MKKLFIALVGLILLVSIGCSPSQRELQALGQDSPADRSGYPYLGSAYPAYPARETAYASYPPYQTGPVYYRTTPVAQRRVVYERGANYYSDYRPQRKRSLKKSVAIVGGSAGGGALIGALAGGKKGALIGGVSGGLAGLAYDLITRNRH